MWGKHCAQDKMDERLSAYIDGALSPRERARLEKQLAEDPALRARLEALRRTVALVRELPPVPAPRNFLLSPGMVAQPARPLSPARRLAPALTFATAISGILCVVLLVANLTTAGLVEPMAAPVPLARGVETTSVAEVAMADTAVTPEDTPSLLRAFPTEEAPAASLAMPSESATPEVPWLGIETPSIIEELPPGAMGGAGGIGGGGANWGGAAPAGPEPRGIEGAPSPWPETETPSLGIAAAPEETIPATLPPEAKVVLPTPTPEAVPISETASLSSWLPVGGLALLTLALAVMTVWAWRAR